MHFLLAVTDLLLFEELYGFATKAYAHFNMINQAVFDGGGMIEN